MSTESSAVSDLLRQLHTRRLGTDPSDALLFHPETPGRARAPLLAPLPRRAQSPVVAPPKPRRSRTWLLIVGTIIAGVSAMMAAIFVRSNGLSVPASAPAPTFAVPQITATVTPEVPAEPTIAPPTIAPTSALHSAPAVHVTVVHSPASPAPRHRTRAQKKPSAKHAQTAEHAQPTADHPRKAEVAPAPSHPARPSPQDDDSENPLR